jgi:hypothetical protein
MAAMKLQEEAEERAQANTETPTYQPSNIGMQINKYRRQTPRAEQINFKDTMMLDKVEEAHVNVKRPRVEAENTNTKNITMAGPVQQASQLP